MYGDASRGHQLEYNSKHIPLSAEINARVPGGRDAMHGIRSRLEMADGYWFDQSGSFMGILPGLEDHRDWPAE